MARPIIPFPELKVGGTRCLMTSEALLVPCGGVLRGRSQGVESVAPRHPPTPCSLCLAAVALQARLDERMRHLGIKVLSIEEEEYCAIPMGGCLPRIPQRVIGIGGTSGMVHPSTGYMVSRVLGAAPLVADAIIDQLSSVCDRAADAGAGAAPRSAEEQETMAAAVWAAMWPVQRVRQREFFEFGMEVLLKLDLQETRDFFSAFFSLSDFHWQGFLSARLSFVELIGFGLSLFVNASNAARTNLLVKGLPGLVVMLSRVAATL